MRKATNDDTVENRFPRAVIVKNLTCDLTRGEALNNEEFTRNRFLNRFQAFRYVAVGEPCQKKKKKKTRLATLNSFDRGSSFCMLFDFKCQGRTGDQFVRRSLDERSML